MLTTIQPGQQITSRNDRIQNTLLFLNQTCGVTTHWKSISTIWFGWERERYQESWFVQSIL